MLVGDLSHDSLIALTLVTLFSLLLVIAFFAYAIFGSKLSDISGSKVFALASQTAVAMFIVFVVVLLMSSDVIKEEVGAPIITGVVGLVFGKGWDVAGSTTANGEVRREQGGAATRQ